MARSLAWTRVAWRPATTEADRDLYRLVLDSFERAQALDPARVPPAAEVSELHRLLSDAAEDTPPSPTGIGFRRGEVNLPLPGGWRVRLPGYFHEDYAVPDETARFWFGDRQVSVTAVASPRDGSDQRPLEAILRELDPPENAEWHHTESTIGFASVFRDTDDEGKAWWVLHGRIVAEDAADDARLFLTVAFADEADRDWALEVWRSVAFESG